MQRKMPERLPPPEVPVENFPSPQTADRILVEWVNIEKASHNPLHPGDRHPNLHKYSGYLFLKQVATEDGRWHIRYWVNGDRNSQDTYNAEIHYGDESSSAPIYVRDYIERRPVVRRADLSTMSGVVIVRVTNGGSGYTSAPAVGFSGGAGSGAAAFALIFRGEVVGVVMTAEGTGYTSAPTVAFTGGGGASAAATAFIQPSTALLVKEDTARMEGDPLDSLYVRVRRVYQTLPGAVVTSKDYDENGILLTITEQDVAAGTAADVPTLLDTESSVTAKSANVSRKRKVTMAGVSTKTSYKELPSRHLLKTVVTFPVAPSTKPTGGPLVLVDRVEAVNAWQSRHITQTIVDTDGSTLVSGVDGYTVWVYDELRQVRIFTTFTYLEASAILIGGAFAPERGSVYANGFANKSWTKEIDDSHNLILGVEWTNIPAPRSEVIEWGKQLPAIFRLGPDLFIAENSPYPGPYPGDGVSSNTYFEVPHRELSMPAKVIYTYHYGQSAAVPRAFRVITPGTASKLLPIKNNTIHAAIAITHSTSEGIVDGLVENIPASIPPVYDPNQAYPGPSSEKHWMSNIWERRTIWWSENLSPNQYGTLYGSQVFKATQQNDILVQPSKSGDTLYIKSTSASDTAVATVFGRNNGGFKKKNVTMTGTTEVNTGTNFDKVIHFRVKADPVGTITLRGPGSGSTGFYTFSGVPADGDTITVGKTAATRTYTFRSPAIVGVATVAKANFVDNSGGAADFFTVGLNSVTDKVYFDFAGTSANPPAAGGGGVVVRVDISALTTSGEVATAAVAAINGDATMATRWFAAPAVGNTFLLYAKQLAASSISDTVADAGFTTSTTTAGTAVAANQIRTTTTPAGAAATVPDIIDYVVSTINLDGTTTSYSSGTTIHADLTASEFATDTSILQLNDKTHAPSSQAWTISDSSTAITSTAFATAGDGPLIAQLLPGGTPPYNRHAFKDVIFTNPDLIEGTPSEAVENVPAAVNVTSDSMLSPVATGVKLRIAAKGTPPLAVSYEVSQDNSAWSSGAVTLPSIGNGQVYEIALTESNLAYIRIKVDNSGGEDDRAVHAEILWPVA